MDWSSRSVDTQPKGKKRGNTFDSENYTNINFPPSSPSISTTLPFLHYHLIYFFILPLSLLLYFPLPFLSLPFSLPTSLPPFTLWSPLPTLLHSLSPPSLPPSILTQQHVPVSLVRDGIDMGWYLMTFLASVELNNIRSVDGVQPVGVDHDTEQA